KGRQGRQDTGGTNTHRDRRQADGGQAPLPAPWRTHGGDLGGDRRSEGRKTHPHETCCRCPTYRCREIATQAMSTRARHDQSSGYLLHDFAPELTAHCAQSNGDDAILLHIETAGRDQFAATIVAQPRRTRRLTKDRRTAVVLGLEPFTVRSKEFV